MQLYFRKYIIDLSNEREENIMTIANTILEQLGGNKFIAMTGAKKLVGLDYSHRFQD